MQGLVDADTEDFFGADHDLDVGLDLLDAPVEVLQVRGTGAEVLEQADHEVPLGENAQVFHGLSLDEHLADLVFVEGGDEVTEGLGVLFS